MSRTYHHISSEERTGIMLELRRGASIREIARALDRAPSTVGKTRGRVHFLREGYGGNALRGRPILAGPARRANCASMVSRKRSDPSACWRCSVRRIVSISSVYRLAGRAGCGRRCGVLRDHGQARGILDARGPVEKMHSDLGLASETGHYIITQ